MDQVGQCPDQLPVPRDPFSEDPPTTSEDITDLDMYSEDTDFSPTSEKLSQWIAQLESEVHEMDKTISKLKGTMNELSEAVVQRERHARRQPSQIGRSSKAA